MRPGLSRHPVTLVAVAAIYYVLGAFGSLGLASTDSVSVLWPPSGFALAAMLLLGRPIWPAILAGAFLVHLSHTGLPLASWGIAVGNVAETVLGAALVERWAGGADAYLKPRSIFRFTALAACFSTTLGATCGALVATSVGAWPWTDFGYVWTIWWLGHLTGVLVVAPLVLLWAPGPFGWPRWRVLVEAGSLLALLVVVGGVVFGGVLPGDAQHYPLEFLCVPGLLWAAFRFGRRETASAVAVLSAIAVPGTLSGYGPFAQESTSASLVLLQSSTSMMALMSCVLAAALAEQRHAEAKLYQRAITDPLTGLANYRRLLDVIRAEIARSNRTTRPFALVFLDVNGLKQINDQHGHVVGNRALCRVAEVLSRSCRVIDTPARFGGDEFAIVLPETADVGGVRVGERVSAALAADATKPTLSVSSGAAVYPRDGDNPTMLLRAADQALYRGKAGLTSPPAQPPAG